MAKWVTMVRDRDPAGPAGCRKEQSFRADVRKLAKRHPDWELAMCRIADDGSGASHWVILGPSSVFARGRWDNGRFVIYSQATARMKESA